MFTVNYDCLIPSVLDKYQILLIHWIGLVLQLELAELELRVSDTVQKSQ